MTPENLHLLPLYIVGWVAGCWLIIAIGGTLPFLAMCKARIEPVSEEESEEFLRLVLSSGKVTGTWATAEGFEPIDVFRIRDRFLNPVIVGWKHVDQNTYLCASVFCKSRVELEFVSCFGGSSHLATGTMRDGQLLPTGPDVWQLSFSVSDTSELWAHHKAALEYLKTTCNLRPVDPDTTLAEFFERAIQHHCWYIRSIPFWVLRIPYWYFVRRFTWHNKPLAELM